MKHYYHVRLQDNRECKLVTDLTIEEIKKQESITLGFTFMNSELNEFDFIDRRHMKYDEKITISTQFILSIKERENFYENTKKDYLLKQEKEMIIKELESYFTNKKFKKIIKKKSNKKPLDTLSLELLKEIKNECK